MRRSTGHKEFVGDQLSLHDIDEPPTASAAQPGETDEQVSRRNSRAFTDWQPALPPEVDTELTSTMLGRFAAGNFSMPKDSH